MTTTSPHTVMPSVGSCGTFPIVFMGSCDFALSIVQALHAVYGSSLVGVFTAPAKPKGRGHRLTDTCVAQWSREHNIPVYTPTSWRSTDACQLLASLKPVVVVVASYGFIIPPEALAIPPMGCVNVHPSLLPRWRGASPIVSTILHGDTQTGVSIMLMDAGMDTGPLLAQETMNVDPLTMTAPALTQQLAHKGGELLTKVLSDYVAGHIQPVSQREDGVTIAHKLHKSMGQLDCHQPAPQLVCRINALQPWPGTWMTMGHESVTILQALARTDAPPVPDVVLGSLITSQDPRLPLFPGPQSPKYYGGIVCAHNTWLYPVTVRSKTGKTLTIQEWMMGYGQNLMVSHR